MSPPSIAVQPASTVAAYAELERPWPLVTVGSYTDQVVSCLNGVTCHGDTEIGASHSTVTSCAMTARLLRQRPGVAAHRTESIGATACLFQQWVEKDYEVRLIAVDGRCFSARIDSSSERGRVDWRADYDSLTYTQIPTPDHVKTAVVKLISALNLRFGALDFIVTPTGEWVFLEINPNGQCAWINSLTPMIASAIADALEGLTAAPCR